MLEEVEVEVEVDVEVLVLVVDIVPPFRVYPFTFWIPPIREKSAFTANFTSLGRTRNLVDFLCIPPEESLIGSILSSAILPVVFSYRIRV